MNFIWFPPRPDAPARTVMSLQFARHIALVVLGKQIVGDESAIHVSILPSATTPEPSTNSAGRMPAKRTGTCALPSLTVKLTVTPSASFVHRSALDHAAQPHFARSGAERMRGHVAWQIEDTRPGCAAPRRRAATLRRSTPRAAMAGENQSLMLRLDGHSFLAALSGRRRAFGTAHREPAPRRAAPACRPTPSAIGRPHERPGIKHLGHTCAIPVGRSAPQPRTSPCAAAAPLPGYTARIVRIRIEQRSRRISGVNPKVAASSGHRKSPAPWPICHSLARSA